jgi:predicted dehydrogenase
MSLGGSFGIGFGLSITSSIWASGSNNNIRVAIVGLYGKGKTHIEDFSAHKGARIVALCDVDRNLLDAEAENLRKAGIPIAAYTDYRKLLENPDIDAVVLAVPHHWHVLMTVWACQAGKNVYVEKPATHNIWEGRQLIAAAKRYGRIVQCGMQRRSDAGWAEALAWINAGNLGKVLFSHGLCYKLRPSIGKTSGSQPIPDGVDYDLWCGPREVVPLRRRNLHYDWHNFWDYGNGEVGNQGVHQMDVAAWASGAVKLPSGVLSVGGRLGYDDDGQTPNTQYVVLDYKPVPIIFEVMGLPFRKGTEAEPIYKNTRVGNIIHCEGGWLSEGTVFDNKGKRFRHFVAGALAPTAAPTPRTGWRRSAPDRGAGGRRPD